MNECMTKYLIVWKHTNTPIKIREGDKLPDPILYWSSKQSASDFLIKNGKPVGEFQIIEISEIGDESVAKMLSTTIDKLVYREYIA